MGGESSQKGGQQSIAILFRVVQLAFDSPSSFHTQQLIGNAFQKKDIIQTKHPRSRPIKG